MSLFSMKFRMVFLKERYLSVLIAIFDITNCTNFPFIQRLFVDAYNIHFQSVDPDRAHKLLQITLNIISSWLSQRGFRFSSFKTSLIIFKKTQNPTLPLPPLQLQGSQIKTRELIKFLPSFLTTYRFGAPPPPHKIGKSNNILKYLSHPFNGCNIKLLIHLYKSLVRSQFDYRAPIYNSASKFALAFSDTIQTTSLRMALGASEKNPNCLLISHSLQTPSNPSLWLSLPGF